MCILCMIQKWSRRVAAMLPWVVIPLVGFWAFSQLLPPPFRFEITSPRLACFSVLLVTLCWYEILMPQLSVWRAKRNARLRERKRFEAIEMQKLRKTATKRCRNCLTPYRDQNPGGSKFMCSYCGHISKRPVLDLPISPGLGISNPEILKDLVGKNCRILNGKVWSDNGWLCGQEWLENGNWAGGSFAGMMNYWKKSGGGFYSGDDHCLTQKSYSCVVIFFCKALTTFFYCIVWLWKKIVRGSSAGDDASADIEDRTILDKRGENGSNYQESRVDKARRKAEEKRLARLEKEQLEEEERKQREEVARLVEERRRQRDEKMETDREHSKGSPASRERDRRKEAEKKRQERKKERGDRGSSKSNSDAEDPDRKTGRESERNKKNEIGHHENQRTGSEVGKVHCLDTENGSRGVTTCSNRVNIGSGYLDRMRGTFLSSSRAFTGSGFFGRGASASASVSRDYKSNGSADALQPQVCRRESSQLYNVPTKPHVNGEDKSINRPVFIERQPFNTPKKSWQQLFTRASSVTSSTNSNVIGRPNGKSQAEHGSTLYAGHPQLVRVYDNPIDFGLPSPFTTSAFSHGLVNASSSPPLAPGALFTKKVEEVPCDFFPEELDIFEDPCYNPDSVSKLSSVSAPLDNLQDLGFVVDTGVDKSHVFKDMPASPGGNHPSPVGSPFSPLHIAEERQATSLHFPGTPMAQDMCNLHVNGLSNSSKSETWQMWSSNPLGCDSLGLINTSSSNTWISPPEQNRTNKEDMAQSAPQKTMASLFKTDNPVHPQNIFAGNCASDNLWLPKTVFGALPGSESQYYLNSCEEVAKNEVVFRNPSTSAASHPFVLSPLNCWPRNDWNMQSSGEAIRNTSIAKPHIGGLYSTPNVQSLWSYE